MDVASAGPVVLPLLRLVTQCCHSKGQLKHQHLAALKRTYTAFMASRAAQCILALVTLRHFGSTVVDVATDILLVYELLPHYFGWVLLAGVFVSDILAALSFHRKLTVHLKSQPDHGKAQLQLSEASIYQGSWARIMLMLYTWALRMPWPAYTPVTALVLLPLLSITVHVQSLLMSLRLIFHTAIKGRPVKEHNWTYLGCLDIRGCVMVRSLVVSLIEAPVAITFTSLAYLLNNKSHVGKYITTGTFLFNAITSMLHILLTAWEVMSTLVRTRSLKATSTELFNISPSQEEGEYAMEYKIGAYVALGEAAVSMSDGREDVGCPSRASAQQPWVEGGATVASSAGSMVPPAISRI